MYVNAITWNEKTTNMRLHNDKNYASRLRTAEMHACSPKKSENLILICNFVVLGVLQIITYTPRELTLLPRFKLEAGLNDDSGAMTPVTRRGGTFNPSLHSVRNIQPRP